MRNETVMWQMDIGEFSNSQMPTIVIGNIKGRRCFNRFAVQR